MSTCLTCSQFSRCCGGEARRGLAGLLQLGLGLGQLLGRLQLQVDHPVSLREKREAVPLHLGGDAHAGGGLNDAREAGRAGAGLVRDEPAVRAEAGIGAVRW